MSAMASRARLLLATRLTSPNFARRTLSAHQGSSAKKGGDAIWAGASLLLFGPTFCPNAPGKHEDHHDDHGHSDDARALYKKPSREPTWSEEDEKADRAARGESDDDEEDGEGTEASESDSDESDSESSDEKDEGGDDGDDKKESDKPKAQQVRSNLPASNRTPRNADPDKLGEAGKHMTNSSAPDPKAFIESFREKKAAGETTGEDSLKGKNKGEVSGDDAKDPESQKKREKR